ncbi:MAG: aromatic amino acid lyase, partial [Casimicrobiaceae bacterium]
MNVSTADSSGTVTLNPGATPLAAWRAIYYGANVALAAQSRVAVDAGAATIERIVALGAPVYGVNTGFGK